MNIKKKILLPLILLLCLFFNTSQVFASNNLSTTFNANNDELTVTVKNESNKELTDVEYNLNLPSEYIAKYELNPSYILAPQEETTFKVKVSKSGDSVSNPKEQRTKTFTSSKNTLDNTGLTSELTVGAVVLLFLLVGVLLYFKQKKVFIVLLVAGIGTQLFPRYSLATDKTRQTENFNDHVTLFESNIPVSLDISYLIVNDSNSDGNTSDNTGNNSGKNGVKPNDKDPKEVLVAGFAYSGKTNSALEEKELKVFDRDKEISTIKTDTEGYFFTHLIQDKIYTIKGEDFEITVTAKNNDNYEHNNIVGKLSLGRIQEDEHTYIKIKPSVAYINEGIEYKVSGNNVTIKGEYKLNSGDKLILAPNHTYLTGFAFIVNESSVSKEETILRVAPITTLESIAEDFRYNEEIDIENMKFIPAPGVTVHKNNSSKNGMNRNSEELPDKLELEINDKSAGTNIKLGLEGRVKYDINLSNKKVIVEPNLGISIEGTTEFKNFSGLKKHPEDPIYEHKLGTFGYITAVGVSAPIDVYVYIDADGNINAKYEYKQSINTKIGYDNKEIFESNQNSEIAFSLNIEGSLEAGVKVTLPGTTLFGSVKILKINFLIGPLLEGTLKGELKYKNHKWGTSASGDATLFARIKGIAELNMLKVLGVDLSINKIIRVKLWSTEKDDNIQENNEIPSFSDEQLAIMARISTGDSHPELYSKNGFSLTLTDKDTISTDYKGIFGSQSTIKKEKDGITINYYVENNGNVREEKKYISYKELGNIFSNEELTKINNYINNIKNNLYTNSQLALIGRKLFGDSLPSYLNKNGYFSMGQENNSLYTSHGVASSIIRVDKFPEEISIMTLDYDKPVGQRDFKSRKKFKINELESEISQEELSQINRLILNYKTTDVYKTTHIVD